MSQPKTKRILILTLAIVIAFFVFALIIGYSISAPTYTGNKSEHFDGKKFINPSGKQAKGLGDVLKWTMQRKREAWKEMIDADYGNAPVANPDPEKIVITFVNHSTFLIQYQGVNILTDPIWSKRTSPFQWAGPKRMRPPGIKFEDLPNIDLILISHNHYDHLDANTMKRLNKAYQPKVMCPLGVAEYIKSLGFSNAYDLDWWQEQSFDNLNIICVPAQHFSGRGMLDRDGTLWAGFVIQKDSTNIYFAGDTGYDQEMFGSIGAKFGKMKVSMIPIGAYKPKWFMSPIHVSPEEGLFIHKDVNSEISIGMHYGTFPLADDGQMEPINELMELMEKMKIASESFILLKEGASETF